MAEVEIARFDDVYEAELAVAFLAAHGVAARVADRGLATIDPLLQRAVGGLRVMTKAGDAPQARDLLARAKAGEFAEEDADGVSDQETAGSTGVAVLSALAGGFSGTRRLRRLRAVHWIGLGLIALMFVVPSLVHWAARLGLILSG